MSQVFTGSFWTKRWYITGMRPQRIVLPSLVGQMFAGGEDRLWGFFPLQMSVLWTTRFLPSALAQYFFPYINTLWLQAIALQCACTCLKMTYNLSTFKPKHFPGPKGVPLKYGLYVHVCFLQISTATIKCVLFSTCDINASHWSVQCCQSISPILYALTLPSPQPV